MKAAREQLVLAEERQAADAESMHRALQVNGSHLFRFIFLNTQSDDGWKCEDANICCDQRVQVDVLGSTNYWLQLVSMSCND